MREKVARMWWFPHQAALTKQMPCFAVTLSGAAKNGNRTFSKASTVVSTTLFGLFVAGLPFSTRAEFTKVMSPDPSPLFYLLRILAACKRAALK